MKIVKKKLKKLITVTTNDGTIQAKKNCILISNISKYEIMSNTEDGTWYLKTSDLLGYNYSNKRHFLLEYASQFNLSLTIVDVINNKPVIAYMPFKSNAIIVWGTSNIRMSRFDIPINNDKFATQMCCYDTSFLRKIATNYSPNYKMHFCLWVDKNINYNKILEFVKVDDVSNGSKKFTDTFGYVYSLKDFSPNLVSKIYKDMISKIEDNKKLEFLLKTKQSDLSFGVELETSSGQVPYDDLMYNSFFPLRDGSIGGYEYTSAPFRDSKGFTAIKNFTKVLNTNCTIDKFCSLHVHIGNHNLSSEQIVAFYMLSYQLQQELFDFTPPYKRSEKYFSEKNEVKDHCKPLKSLGLYTIYKNDSISTKYSKIKEFVLPPNMNINDPKWNQFSRYFHINLLPLFSNSGTIEFRLHEPTTSYHKILLWMGIITTMVKYAINNTNDIINGSKISLFDVVNTIEDEKFRDILINYIKERIIIFTSEFNQGQYNSSEYLRKDKTYSNKDLERYLNE